MNLYIEGIVGQYKFDCFGDVVTRLAQWVRDGLITEKQLAAYIIQLYNQIPEGTYNDIINEM